MSTRKVTNSIFVLCLFGIFVSNALSASPETMLIGKWKYFKGKEIEFVKDGTLIIGDQGAKYRVIDRERIEFDLGMVAMFSNLGGPRPVFRFTVSNDELTLIPLAKPNEPEKLRRVKVDASGNDAHTYVRIAGDNFKQRNYQQGIKNLDKALEIDPKWAGPYNYRGWAYEQLSNYQQAIKDYSKAIELDPGNAYHYNGLAWVLATVETHSFRNGKKAVELALKACELSGWKTPNFLDTLAAAYARVGDFDNAVKWQKKALESSKHAKSKEAQQRLNLYGERKAWPPD